MSTIRIPQFYFIIISHTGIIYWVIIKYLDKIIILLLMLIATYNFIDLRLIMALHSDAEIFPNIANKLLYFPIMANVILHWLTF